MAYIYDKRMDGMQHIYKHELNLGRLPKARTLTLRSKVAVLS